MGSVRLGRELETQIRQVAALKGLTLSNVHRRALAEYCKRETAPVTASQYDDIIGIGEGTRDLAARSEEIFGEVMDEKHRRRHGH